MKALLIRVFVVALLLCSGAGNVFATTSDGAVSEQLSQHLYCSVGDLLEGNIGLMLGLMLVFLGLWALIQGAKIAAVIPIIIIGSLVTALPTMIESSFKGLGTLLKETKISKTDFTPPTCGSMTITAADMDARMKDPHTGTYYPSRGAYTPSSDCKSGDMREICRR